MIVVVRRRAIRQVETIARYIAKDRPSAAAAFVAVFNDVTRLLEEHPFSAPLVRPSDLRQATMSRFPYVVIYRATSERVTILGVFHAARDPVIRTNR